MIGFGDDRILESRGDVDWPVDADQPNCHSWHRHPRSLPLGAVELIQLGLFSSLRRSPGRTEALFLFSIARSGTFCRVASDILDLGTRILNREREVCEATE